MSKLREFAIERSRALPEAEQDWVAEMLLRAIDPRSRGVPLDPETIEALDEGLNQAERGEFASESEIIASWARRGE